MQGTVTRCLSLLHQDLNGPVGFSTITGTCLLLLLELVDGFGGAYGTGL